jgi:hypothetical protein
MADVAPGIITFGLGGSHTNMIIGNIFQLGYITVGSPIIPPEPPEPEKDGGGGGGGVPLAPGQIGKLYKPVGEDPWGTLQDFPDGSRFPVTIKLEFREHKLERNYIVSKKRAGTIVNVIQFSRKIHDTANIIITNFKKKTLKVLGRLNIRKK